MKNSEKAKNVIDKSLQRDIESVVRGSRTELSTLAHDYLRMLVDPRGCKAVRGVAPQSGCMGSTGLVTCSVKGQAVTGTGNIAFISANPADTGPFGDRRACHFSNTSANVLTSASLVPIADVAGQIASANWSAPYNAAGLTPDLVQFVPKAAAIYVKPDAKVLDQGGMLYLHESAGHGSLSAAPFSSIIANKRTRGVMARAPAAGSREEVVLNWHPKTVNQFTNQIPSDFAWRSMTSAQANVPFPTLVVVMEAATGTTFHFEYFVDFEVQGLAVLSGLRPSLTDSRGWDLVSNCLAAKLISGWEGKSPEAQHSYLAALYHHGKKAGLIDEVVKIAESSEHIPSELKSLAKAVAGFFF